MGEQIDRIVWHEHHQLMEVVYSERKSDRIFANELVAERLASDAGLVLVPARLGIISWVRPPEPSRFGYSVWPEFAPIFA